MELEELVNTEGREQEKEQVKPAMSAFPLQAAILKPVQAGEEYNVKQTFELDEHTFPMMPELIEHRRK